MSPPDRYGDPDPDDDDAQADLEAEYVPRTPEEIRLRCEDIRQLLRATRANRPQPEPCTPVHDAPTTLPKEAES